MSQFHLKDWIPSDEVGVFEALTSQQKLALIRSDNMMEGIGGYLLDIIEEDQSELTSEITDHYVENNTSIQDHITLAPEEVVLHGVVSELSILRTVVPSKETPQIRNALSDRSDLGPVFTPGAEENFEFATPPTPPKSGVLRKFENAKGVIGNRKGAKQADVFNYLYQIWKGRQFVNVETAWGTWPNMAIKTLRAVQNKESRQVSEFWVTFKSIRFASDILVKSTPTAFGRAEDQKAEATPLGTAGKTPFEVFIDENMLALP
jgi:hypothetical protein